MPWWWWWQKPPWRRWRRRWYDFASLNSSGMMDPKLVIERDNVSGEFRRSKLSGCMRKRPMTYMETCRFVGKSWRGCASAGRCCASRLQRTLERSLAGVSPWSHHYWLLLMWARHLVGVWISAWMRSSQASLQTFFQLFFHHTNFLRDLFFVTLDYSLLFILAGSNLVRWIYISNLVRCAFMLCLSINNTIAMECLMLTHCHKAFAAPLYVVERH